jgi:hypothetical protein
MVGIASADTLILYSSNDGSMERGTPGTWSQIRDGTGTIIVTTESAATLALSSTTSNVFSAIDRYGMTYNLSSLSGTTITSTTLYLFSRNVSGVTKANTYTATYNRMGSGRL